MARECTPRRELHQPASALTAQIDAARRPGRRTAYRIIGLAGGVLLFAAGAAVVGQAGSPSTPSGASGDVLTHHNDARRTGANLAETRLTPAAVKVSPSGESRFGKLFSYQVCGQIYAQPLYKSGVEIGGRLRNVLYVATEKDRVYAFDADAAPGGDGEGPPALWVADLCDQKWGVPAGVAATPVPSSDYDVITEIPIVGWRLKLLAYTDLVPEIGITGTPVIDPGSQTLYVVAATRETTAGAAPAGVSPEYRYFHRLHALDLRTGEEKAGGPVEIAGEVDGDGDAARVMDGRLRVPFISQRQLQRPALLLHDGVVYVAFGSHADLVGTNPWRPAEYHGWVFAYDARTLERLGVFNTTPHGVTSPEDHIRGDPAGAGIWMSGAGPAADADGNVYLSTANGEFNADRGGSEYGDSVLKLQLDRGARTLAVRDSFTPANHKFLRSEDLDLGSMGVLLLPESDTPAGMKLLVAGGKEGRLYLIDREQMGRSQPRRGRRLFGLMAVKEDQCLQSFQITRRTCRFGHFHGAPVYWNGPNGPTIYVWAEQDHLKAFQLTNGRLGQAPADWSRVTAPRFSMPGAVLSLSANGGRDGIVWASMPAEGDANPRTVPGALRAFDANNLREALWDSDRRPTDGGHNFAKYCPPTIANGRVYLPTFSDALVVFGLRDDPRSRLAPE